MNLIEILKQKNNKFIKAISLIDNWLKDSDIEQIIDLIITSNINHGNIIISGLGKTGHIGNILVAGLRSVGINTNFVHATEASHGDLGVLNNKSIVIIITKSGASIECYPLINYCKEKAIKLIALTMNQDSYLTKKADYKLIIPKVHECKPVELLPTTSNLLFTAICELLKLGIVEKTKFTQHDFITTHPGGKIGNSQNNKVKNIMRTGKSIPVMNENQVASNCLTELSNKNCGCVAIIDNQEQLIGIITDGDIRRNITDINFLQKIAKDVMSKKPLTINMEINIKDAQVIMAEKAISQLLVVENNKLIGIIHQGDILRNQLQYFDIPFYPNH